MEALMISDGFINFWLMISVTAYLYLPTTTILGKEISFQTSMMMNN